MNISGEPKRLYIIKVHIFRRGHKILRNLPLTFDCMYCGQNFCGLLRIYEHYIMAIGVMEFSNEVYKIRKIFA